MSLLAFTLRVSLLFVFLSSGIITLCSHLECLLFMVLYFLMFLFIRGVGNCQDVFVIYLLSLSFHCAAVLCNGGLAWCCNCVLSLREVEWSWPRLKPYSQTFTAHAKTFNEAFLDVALVLPWKVYKPRDTLPKLLNNEHTQKKQAY